MQHSVDSPSEATAAPGECPGHVNVDRLSAYPDSVLGARVGMLVVRANQMRAERARVDAEIDRLRAERDRYWREQQHADWERGWIERQRRRVAPLPLHGAAPR